MDFINKILGRPKKDTPKQPSDKSFFTLEEIEEDLANLLIKKKEQNLKVSKSPVEDIIKQKKISKDVIVDLKDLDFDEDIKDKTYRPILTSKPIYVRGMLDALKGIRETSPSNYEDLETFYSGLSKAMKTIHGIQQKKGKYMSFAFRKEMLKLGGSLNRIIDSMTELEKNIREVDEIQTKNQGVLSNVARVKEINKEQIEELGRREEKNKEHGKLERKIEKLEEDLKKLEGSKNYRSILDQEKQLESLLGKKKNLLASSVHLLGPLHRPLRKYERFLQKKGETDKKTIEKVKEYLKSSNDALNSEDPDNILIIPILMALQKAVKIKNIALSEREEKKSLAVIEQILKDDNLSNWINEIQRYDDRSKELREMIKSSSVLDEREKLLEIIGSENKRLESFDLEIGASVETDSSELHELKEKIEKGFEGIFERKVEIDILNN